MGQLTGRTPDRRRRLSVRHRRRSGAICELHDGNGFARSSGGVQVERGAGDFAAPLRRRRRWRVSPRRRICGRASLYGTANGGGSAGGGVVFKLVGKKETVLHSFTGRKDGTDLTSGLLMDVKPNLYPGTHAYRLHRLRLAQWLWTLRVRLTGNQLDHVLQLQWTSGSGHETASGTVTPEGNLDKNNPRRGPGRLQCGYGIQIGPKRQGTRAAPVPGDQCAA